MAKSESETKHDPIVALCGKRGQIQLLVDYLAAPSKSLMHSEIGYVPEKPEAMLLILRINVPVCLVPDEARQLARWLLDRDTMPPPLLARADELQRLSRFLTELANDADAMRPSRLH